jgi:hypothetical protein
VCVAAHAALNKMARYVHVLLSSPAHPKTIRAQLKAWCTRQLNEQQADAGIPEQEQRNQWWAERDSIRWIIREADLAAAIDYVLNQQDNSNK